MGGQPCRLKAILNGETIESEARMLCYQIRQPEIEIPDDAGYKIVEELNTAEDAMFRAKRIFLESQGFDGPWPHALNGKG